MKIIHIFLLTAVMFSMLYGQDFNQYIQSDKNYTFHDVNIDDMFLQETIQELPNPRLLQFDDFEKAGKTDLLVHGVCYGRTIQYGDFNRDKVLDIAVLGTSDNKKMFIVIYSFPCEGVPTILFMTQLLGPPVGAMCVNELPWSNYPNIMIAFTMESDHLINLRWDGKTFIDEIGW